MFLEHFEYVVYSCNSPGNAYDATYSIIGIIYGLGLFLKVIMLVFSTCSHLHSVIVVNDILERIAKEFC